MTGSVFEGGEGAGSQGLPDFSPYGLSKALTAQMFRYYCARAGLGLGKFVIPNPFGPYEEPRFTAYLMKNWLAGATPICSQPVLCPRQYPRLAAGQGLRPVRSRSSRPPASPGSTPAAMPRARARSRSAWPRRCDSRLGLPCSVELKKQVDFPEPRVRINTDPPDADALGWDESAAWDEMARYYQRSRAT